MNVGFSIDYGQNDGTLMATRLASCIQDLGGSVSILPRRRHKPVHTFWDRYAGRASCNPLSWLRKGNFSHLIFDEVPPDSFVDVLVESKVVAKVLVLLSWDSLSEADIAVLPKLSNVICPSAAVHSLIKARCPSAKLCCLPWDTGSPIVRNTRRTDARAVKLFWALSGSQGFHQDQSLILFWEELLEDNKNLHMTISYSSRPGQSVNWLLARSARSIFWPSNIAWRSDRR